MSVAGSTMEGKFGRHEALVMRIRTLKWQAIALQASTKHQATRDEAVKVIAELDDIQRGLEGDRSDDTVAKAETQADAISILLASLGHMH